MIEDALTRSVIDCYPGATVVGGKLSGGTRLRRAMPDHPPSFRGDAKHRRRTLEIPGSVLRTAPE